MAEAVVDALEVVDVDRHHRDRMAMAPTVGDGAQRRLMETAPVEDAGQRIVGGEHPQPRRDVRRHQQDRRDAIGDEHRCQPGQVEVGEELVPPGVVGMRDAVHVRDDEQQLEQDEDAQRDDRHPLRRLGLAIARPNGRDRDGQHRGGEQTIARRQPGDRVKMAESLRHDEQRGRGGRQLPCSGREPGALAGADCHQDGRRQHTDERERL